MDKLNHRISAEDCLDNETSRETKPSSAITPSRARENQTSRFDLESILWIAVSGIVMYYTDFWNLVLHDIRVKRQIGSMIVLISGVHKRHRCLWTPVNVFDSDHCYYFMYVPYQGCTIRTSMHSINVAIRSLKQLRPYLGPTNCESMVTLPQSKDTILNRCQNNHVLQFYQPTNSWSLQPKKNSKDKIIISNIQTYTKKKPHQLLCCHQ